MRGHAGPPLMLAAIAALTAGVHVADRNPVGANHFDYLSPAVRGHRPRR